MSEIDEETIARAPADLPTSLATQIMALDWKARKDWTVEEQADRHGELQEMIEALVLPAIERARVEERERERDRSARVIEDNQLMHTSGGDVLTPRTEGNRNGLSYAAAIRKG